MRPMSRRSGLGEAAVSKETAKGAIVLLLVMLAVGVVAPTAAESVLRASEVAHEVRP